MPRVEWFSRPQPRSWNKSSINPTWHGQIDAINRLIELPDKPEVQGPEAERVTKTALANYVVNSDPDGVDHGLKDRPMLAFALCYVAAHLALDLLDERQADAILTYCEGHLNELETGA